MKPLFPSNAPTICSPVSHVWLHSAHSGRGLGPQQLRQVHDSNDTRRNSPNVGICKVELRVSLFGFATRRASYKSRLEPRQVERAAGQRDMAFDEWQMRFARSQKAPGRPPTISGMLPESCFWTATSPLSGVASLASLDSQRALDVSPFPSINQISQSGQATRAVDHPYPQPVALIREIAPV